MPLRTQKNKNKKKTGQLIAAENMFINNCLILNKYDNN